MDDSTAMRWQYAVASIGMFDAQLRMTAALAALGERGFELVAVYDKASNWFQGMEKGFLLFKRPVLPGQKPDGPWCATLQSIVNGQPSWTGDANYGYPEGQAW